MLYVIFASVSDSGLLTQHTGLLLSPRGFSTAAYEKVFTMFHEMDTQGGGPANITNVTVFGLVDHYRDGDQTNTRLFNKDYEPKPAFIKVRAVMETY